VPVGNVLENNLFVGVPRTKSEFFKLVLSVLTQASSSPLVRPPPFCSVLNAPFSLNLLADRWFRSGKHWLADCNFFVRGFAVNSLQKCLSFFAPLLPGTTLKVSCLVKRALVVWIVGGGAVFAKPVTWTITGLSFDDGSTASGFFVYDADTDIISNRDLATTAVWRSRSFRVVSCL
jgi:hypothetical protein